MGKVVYGDYERDDRDILDIWHYVNCLPGKVTVGDYKREDVEIIPIWFACKCDGSCEGQPDCPHAPGPTIRYTGPDPESF